MSAPENRGAVLCVGGAQITWGQFQLLVDRDGALSLASLAAQAAALLTEPPTP